MRLQALIWLAFLSVVAQLVTHTAQAQLSNWTDERAVLVHSDPLPSDSGRLEQLQDTGKASLTPLEKRTLEIINEYTQGRSSEAPSDAVPALSFPSAHDSASTPMSVDPATENARDPCLLSWDPKCYEKHAQDYHPLWGYAPSMLRSSR